MFEIYNQRYACLFTTVRGAKLRDNAEYDTSYWDYEVFRVTVEWSCGLREMKVLLTMLHELLLGRMTEYLQPYVGKAKPFTGDELSRSADQDLAILHVGKGLDTRRDRRC